tara:strand:+ start:196 stop:561 length:366 start_codon:yes stop_codon:yes gene_type:complete
MSELKITGKITKVLELQTGTSKAGKDWQKLNFIVETEAEYNNVYCFELFGDDKIESFNKWNKVGSKVTIGFNVNCNEYKGKYYTSLSAWNIFNEFKDAPTEAEKDSVEDKSVDNQSDDLPF